MDQDRGLYGPLSCTWICAWLEFPGRCLLIDGIFFYVRDQGGSAAAYVESLIITEIGFTAVLCDEAGCQGIHGNFGYKDYHLFPLLESMFHKGKGLGQGLGSGCDSFFFLFPMQIERAFDRQEGIFGRKAFLRGPS